MGMAETKSFVFLGSVSEALKSFIFFGFVEGVSGALILGSTTGKGGIDSVDFKGSRAAGSWASGAWF